MGHPYIACARTAKLFRITVVHGARRITLIRFEYVVRKQDQQKICFGSGCPRDTSSRRGMTPFMRHYAKDEYENIAANKYNVSESYKTINTKPCSRSISKRGYSGIARFATTIQHTEDFPAPCDYDISSCSKVKELKYPFASTAKRKTFLTNKNPGPGMYINSGKRVITFDHSFGGKMKMRLGVELKCCKRNTDICYICGEKPFGDYWHCNNKTFLCRGCMVKERLEHTKFTQQELNSFYVRFESSCAFLFKVYINIIQSEIFCYKLQKLRDCSDIHSHEGTDAKVWLVHPKTVEKWTRNEAYLSAYLKD
ncbi:uncharacterized protein LOC107266821 isoform X2 [Cephus cinctus]|uniref:Uncharacterized protein LOC107266821 isoform X2 n=1 Tax=Cephus cinctus TaxID=211228 RepID=A0AAJ7BSF1_CEPCN|nr:uncharacterized protein LOC107266821 isoform X2 [Cephus cinctus]